MTIGLVRYALAIRGILPTVLTVVACSNSVLSQCSDTQFTVANVEEHFRLQATNGSAFKKTHNSQGATHFLQLYTSMAKVL